MNRYEGSGLDIEVWWVTIDGCTHLEMNPVVIEGVCGWPARSTEPEE